MLDAMGRRNIRKLEDVPCAGCGVMFRRDRRTNKCCSTACRVAVRRQNPADRFWAKVEKSDGCWLWKAGKFNKTGYGCFKCGGVSRLAHRFSYELSVGPIPDGLELDHLCRVKACVNPAHLEAVPRRVNILRGVSPMAKAAQRTHCVKGHKLQPYMGPDTQRRRICKVCMRQRGREYEQRRKAARLA